ncbi:hypothetical protein ABIF50_008223 [Bradyrhizobium diazoefficiens]
MALAGAFYLAGRRHVAVIGVCYGTVPAAQP